MSSIHLYQYFEVDVDGQRRSGGSRSAPAVIPVDAVLLDARREVEEDSTWLAWENDGEFLDNYRFIWAESSESGILMDFNDGAFSIGMLAGTPVVIRGPGDVTIPGMTPAESIRFINPDQSGVTPTVRLFIIK